LGKKVRFWTGASVADNADYVMLHKEERRRFSMTMNRSEVGARVVWDIHASELTGVRIAREVFRGVYRCSGGG
jgi:hypothetical protein